MKRRRGQPKTSGISLIEIIAVIAIFFIVSLSVQVVSDGRAKRNPRELRNVTTNQLGRDFHAPTDEIHTYAPRH